MVFNKMLRKGKNMGMEWYDMIALRNGGYKNNATYTVEGVSGEDVFEERLIKFIRNSNSVLDAGCGHGEFTIKMGKYANNLVGFDNSKELIKVAEEILKESKVDNVSFVYAWTKDKQPLPFKDEQFDLIYNRRGPTSIIDHSRILRSGGTIYGIHSGGMEKVKQRLENNKFINIEIEVFDEAMIYFPNEHEFTKYISSLPGSPDYSLPEYKEELQTNIKESKVNGKLALKQWRYIWNAVKP